MACNELHFLSLATTGWYIAVVKVDNFLFAYDRQNFTYQVMLK